ncbi:MAG: VacB/RNase II family 3'-5' exoribonuclease [Planctomycetaceae bacterium]|jgi:ribonuclease R|nr:VacB/RNase II family 3'-5' exoribonuclease [Planctomycetaceae bacterium]
MLSRDEIRNAILDIVRQSKYTPHRPKQFAHEICPNQPMEVKQVIRRMVNAGELVFGKKHYLFPGPNNGKFETLEEAVEYHREQDHPRKNDLRVEPFDNWLDDVRHEIHGRHEMPNETQQTLFNTGDGKILQAKKKNPALENFVIGTFRQTEQGNGFVRPRADSPALTLDTKPPFNEPPLLPDIFIPAGHSRDAASGDVVAVEILYDPKRDKGKRRIESEWQAISGHREGELPVGKIVEILERETMRFVGTYICDEDKAEVEVDGKLFRNPIYVGDPSACSASFGNKVVIDVVRFPTHTRYGEGVVVEILGPRGTPELDTQLIIHQYGLPTEFPKEVLQAALEQASQFDESIGDDRYDATGETTLTIDPPDARDFDDAISLVKLDGGHWRLGVHIADVSHFVPPGSVLDKEAYKRSTSVYLTDKVIPMLPEVISNSLASLQPDKVRYTRSVWMEYTEDGILVDVEIKRSAIRSDARLNYEQVTDFLAAKKSWRAKLKPNVFRLLNDMFTLAMILRDRRIKRGAIELTTPEIKLLLDKDGKVCGTKLVEHTLSHQIIEEFMLAANDAVASFLEENGTLFLRRVHPLPGLRKLKQFSTFVKSLGIKSVSANTLLESRFEIQDLLKRVHGRPEESAVNYAFLRSMQKAVYSPIEDGHYALASPCYCHFTSPIRRYPDLTIHRLLDQVIYGTKPHNDAQMLFLLGEHCSQCERNAEEAERELTKLKLINYLATKIGERMTGVITGVECYGFFVQGEKIPAEGLIRLRSMKGRFFYDADSHVILGKHGLRLRLGDRVVIEVVKANPDTRRIDYKFIEVAPNKPFDDSAQIGELYESRSEKKSKKFKKKMSAEKFAEDVSELESVSENISGEVVFTEKLSGKKTFDSIAAESFETTIETSEKIPKKKSAKRKKTENVPEKTLEKVLKKASKKAAPKPIDKKSAEQKLKKASSKSSKTASTKTSEKTRKKASKKSSGKIIEKLKEASTKKKTSGTKTSSPKQKKAATKTTAKMKKK